MAETQPDNADKTKDDEPKQEQEQAKDEQEKPKEEEPPKKEEPPKEVAKDDEKEPEKESDAKPADKDAGADADAKPGDKEDAKPAADKEDEKEEKKEEKKEPSEFQLYYWKGNGGRGTLARLCMAVCGVEWDEKNQDDAKDVKGANIKGFPNFAMPILQHQDIIISQTPAICIYIMEKYGFAPADSLEKVYALQAALTAHDASGEWYVKLNKLIGFDKWIRDRMGSFLNTLENQLKRNNDGKGWFFSDKPCVADVFVADFMRRYKFCKADHYKACKFNVLKKHCQRFEELERVKKYLESDAYKKVKGTSGWMAL